MAHRERLDDHEIASGQLVPAALTTAAGGADDNEAQAGHLVIGALSTQANPSSDNPGGLVVDAPRTFAHQVGGTRTSVIHDVPGLGRTLIASQGLAVHHGSVVRRLTPLERERLMGWPDGWTAQGIDDDGATIELSDTQRRRITGNGVVAPVAEWIGHRLPAEDAPCVAGV